MSHLQDFLREVESWVGTPFFTEGCTKGPKGGANCAHWFADAVSKSVPGSEAILEAFDWTHMAIITGTRDVMPEIMEKVAIEISLKEIQPGDILFTRIRRKSSTPAVYFGDGQFVWCNWSMKQIVKMPVMENYLKRLTHVYRLKAFVEEK